MTDNEQVSVCLTSEEYDTLIKIQSQYQKQQIQHQRQLQHANNIRQKQVSDLSQALQKSLIKQSELQKAQKALKQEIISLKQQMTATEAKYHQKIVEVEEIKAANQNQTKDSKQLSLQKSYLEKQLQLKQRSIKKLQKEAEIKSNLILSLESSIQKQALIKKPQPNSKEYSELENKYNNLMVEKNELVDKYKIAELRMESKEEFVCSYYEAMREKLHDFDKSEVRDLINHDIDDFIRYLTMKKSVKK